MKPKFFCLMIAFLSAMTILLSACGGEPSYEDRETFAPEVLTPVEGGELILQDGLRIDGYPLNEPIGEWLAGCSRPDRNDHFQAYTLRREISSEGNTSFTYIIYYPHGGAALTVKSALSQTDNGYIIDLTYEEGDGTQDYSLCYLSVTLPTDKAPRLRLTHDEETLGVLSTVTVDPITTPAGGN